MIGPHGAGGILMTSNENCTGVYDIEALDYEDVSIYTRAPNDSKSVYINDEIKTMKTRWTTQGGDSPIESVSPRLSPTQSGNAEVSRDDFALPIYGGTAFVRLVGLKDAARNGQIGSATHRDKGTGRYAVTLHGDTSPISIKAANLVTYVPNIDSDVCRLCGAGVNRFAFPPCSFGCSGTTPGCEGGCNEDKIRKNKNFRTYKNQPSTLASRPPDPCQDRLSQIVASESSM